MKIVIDMQGAQTASRFRGIGRYTLALVTEMARQRGSHEMLLVLNGAYADTIEPLRAAFAELLPLDAIRVFEVAGPVGGHDAANEARRKAAEAMREAFIASLQPDVLFIPSLFEEFGGEAVTSVHGLHNAIPTAVVLYDLIPLIHRQIYLSPNPVMTRWYFGKLDHLKRADLLLSISESSGREAIEHLNFPESRVINISTASDAQFHPIALSDAQRAHLKTTYGIDRPFVMAAGDSDARKNLDGLLSAFARLPAEQRATYSLVIPGRGVVDHESHFLSLSQQVSLHEGELILPGYVPDQDLVLLYNACTLFVFPSWHEGFGLPVLEAMACGKAAIAANSSSLPEVVGRADALFAPRDAASMSTKMAEVLGNPKFRYALEQHGLNQAKKFSWHTSAERAWAALHTLHAQHQQRAATAALCTPSKRPRLAFVSPLPPEKTGIADYAAELLPELARHYEITVIVEQDEVADAWVQANAPIRNAAWFRQHAQQFDRVVYQFGNSPFHSHMFDLLAEIPGMVVLHDFYLSWPVWHRDEHGPARHGWARALLAGHGWDAVRERMQVGSWNDVVEVVTKYPCNLAVLQQAQGIIVHSDFSRRLAREFYGKQTADDWALIPHLRQPAELGGKADARARLGLSNTDFIVCSFGGLDPTKMNHRLLDAWLASPLAQDAACRLVFVGENHSGEYGQALVKTITQSPAKDRVTMTGWADVETFRTWLAAADVGVQLRTLSRGETSGTVLDCMNYGLPTIINANGSMADLPADAVWLLPDAFDDAQLIDALVVLHRDASEREALGARARQHILTQHNPRTCAEQYAQAIESAYSQANQGLQGLLQALPRLNPTLPPSEYSALAGTLAANFPPSPRRRQLLLDISALVKTDLWSGIERVTRALLTEVLKAPPTGWAVEPVYATADHPGYRYARKFTSRFLNLPDEWAEDAPVQVWQGDIFFGLDLQPQVVPAQEPTLQSWRQRGVGVYFVVHDLLPVTMLEVFPDGARDGHQRWLQTISRFDGVFCVSRHVANEFYEWLQVFGEQRQRPYTLNWFHHGADLANSAPSLGLPGDAAQTLAALKARPSFLMVGTIEPRKGYLQTLHAFDALWAQGVDVNLVIVGKEGWKPLPDDQRRDIPLTIQALRNHAEKGKRLFWLEGISDEYLEQIYAHAACLIGASFDEGFGLPLIEAARHGVPLLVRDIPVFREVTDGHAYYFADRREPQVIQDAIQQWLALFELGTHPRSTAMPHQTWSESAQQVLNGIFARTAPYKTWLPDGVRRYWGADPRLHTEVGQRSGKTIQSTGKAGMLIYGPYEQFEPGHYRVVFSGESKHWTGEEWLDVTCDQGKRKLFHTDIGTKSLGAWQITQEFNLEASTCDLEIRLWVSDLTNIKVQNLTLVKNEGE
jgi:glycosyltransferase involved in cell wall biosynthesis